MKTLFMIGITSMVGGLLLITYGYELCVNFICLGPHCPSCEAAEPISHITIYVGIAVMLGGVGFLVYSRKK